jgi:spore maturation protein CgeB
MRIVMFYHSLVSDWNHGNAHFLRGVAADLIRRGHDLRIYEPRNNWSLANLLHDHGRKALRLFEQAYPDFRSTAYNPAQSTSTKHSMTPTSSSSTNGTSPTSSPE